MTSSSGDAVARALSELKTFSVLTGVYLGSASQTMSWVRIVGEEEPVAVHSTNVFEPIVGDEHWIWWSDSLVIMWGPKKPREQSGTIDSIVPSPTGVPLFTVRTDRGTIYRDLRAYMPSIRVRDETGRALTVEPGYDVGDHVSINWNLDGGVIDGLFSPTTGTGITPEYETSTSGAAEFRATWASDWNGTAWQSPAAAQLWVSPVQSLFVGYGTAPADTIPDFATGVTASIYLPLVGPTADVGYPVLGVHTGSVGRPAAAPSFDGVGQVPGQSGWIDLSAEQARLIVRALRTGAGGLVLTNGGGTLKLADLAADDLGFALRLGWST